MKTTINLLLLSTFLACISYSPLHAQEASETEAKAEKPTTAENSEADAAVGSEQDTDTAEISEKTGDSDASAEQTPSPEGDTDESERTPPKPASQADDASATTEASPAAAVAPAAANETDTPANQPPAPQGGTRPLGKSGELRFNFSGVTWPDVLDWFADQADLALQT